MYYVRQLCRLENQDGYIFTIRAYSSRVRYAEDHRDLRSRSRDFETTLPCFFRTKIRSYVVTVSMKHGNIMGDAQRKSFRSRNIKLSDLAYHTQFFSLSSFDDQPAMPQDAFRIKHKGEWNLKRVNLHSKIYLISGVFSKCNTFLRDDTLFYFYRFQSASLGASWLLGSRRPYRFRSLIKARICTGRAPLGPRVQSGDNGIAESRETVRIPCLPPCSPKVESSGERGSIQTRGERELLCFHPPLHLHGAKRKTESDDLPRPTRGTFDTTIIVAIHAGFCTFRRYPELVAISSWRLPTPRDVTWHARRKSIPDCANISQRFVTLRTHTDVRMLVHPVFI